jgi:hypothetical protein
LALVALLGIAAVTLTTAQENRGLQRPAAEIKADIEKLQAELREVEPEAEIVQVPVEPSIKVFRLKNRHASELIHAISIVGRQSPHMTISIDSRGGIGGDSFVVFGTPSEHAAFESLLKELDVAPNTAQERGGVGLPVKDEPVFSNSYSLAGIPVEKAMRFLSSFVGVESTLNDAGTHVFVTGSKVSHENVREILAQLLGEEVAKLQAQERGGVGLPPASPQVPLHQQMENMRQPMLQQQPMGGQMQPPVTYEVVRKVPETRIVDGKPVTEYKDVVERVRERDVPVEGPTFVTYSLSENHELVVDVVRTVLPKLPQIMLDKESNLLFVVGNAEEHRRIRIFLAQFQGKANAEADLDGLLVKIYSQPEGVSVDFSVFVAQRFKGIANVWVVNREPIHVGDGQGNFTAKTLPFVVVGHKSAHDTVREMFEQIKKAKGN